MLASFLNFLFLKQSELALPFFVILIKKWETFYFQIYFSTFAPKMWSLVFPASLPRIIISKDQVKDHPIWEIFLWIIKARIVICHGDFCDRNSVTNIFGCWQLLDVGDRFRMLVTDLHWENHQHFANIMIRPPTSEISHNHKVINVMMSPT